MRSPALLLTLPLLAVAGCGGGGDDKKADKPGSSADQKAAESVAKQYTTAFADGDAKKACALLTDAGRRQALQNKTAKFNTCEKVFANFHDQLPKASLALLRDGKPQPATIRSGKPPTATVVLVPPQKNAQSTTIKLRKIDGTWKIDQDAK